MIERRVSVDSGKYTFVIRDGDYIVRVLRYGDKWLSIEAGSNAVYALVDEIIEARQPSVPTMTECATGFGNDPCHEFAPVEAWCRYCLVERVKNQDAAHEKEAEIWRRGAEGDANHIDFLMAEIRALGGESEWNQDPNRIKGE